MKKLIITIACAFAAQAQGDDDIWSRLRQSNQTDQITQAIEDQGERIEKAIKESTQPQPKVTASFTWEETLAIEAEERAARDAARGGPIPSAPLPTNGLSEEDIKRTAPYFGQFKAK